MKMRLSVRKSLALSCISMLLCISMLIGTTYAWFSESVTSHNNKIVSGTLTMTVSRWNGSGFENLSEKTDTSLFNYSKWEPGYTHGEILRLANTGTLSLKYRAVFKGLDLPVDTSELSLADVIEVYAFSNPQTGGNTIPDSRADLLSDPWKKLGTLREFLGKGNVVTGTLMPKDKTDSSCDIGIALSMVDDADTKYQGLDLGNFDISLFATQLTNEKDSFDENYDYKALTPWDGITIDTNWYDKNKTEFTITNAEQLAGLSYLVNNKTDKLNEEFQGKTIKLASDINLGSHEWNGIGIYKGSGARAFKGTFDGDGHIIYNMVIATQSNNRAYRTGFFSLVENAVIKNITFENALITSNHVNTGSLGIVVGVMKGGTFDNIKIIDCEVRGHNTIGALIGSQYTNSYGTVPGSQKVYITNCTVSNTKLSGNYRVGGLVGFMKSVKTVANNNVDAQFDLIGNDYYNYNGHEYFRTEDNNTCYIGQGKFYCDDITAESDGIKYVGNAHDS